jgi:hypothetical protein
MQIIILNRCDAIQEKEVNGQDLNAILQIGNGCMRLMTPVDD